MNIFFQILLLIENRIHDLFGCLKAKIFMNLVAEAILEGFDLIYCIEG